MKLKKFLFKNQEYKFKENEKNKLFNETEVNFIKKFYVSSIKSNESLKDSVFSLLEDALVMPFNVFATSHKNKMLKWYENLQKGDNLDCKK